jgi:hypothetical protein
MLRFIGPCQVFQYVVVCIQRPLRMVCFNKLSIIYCNRMFDHSISPLGEVCRFSVGRIGINQLSGIYIFE